MTGSAQPCDFTASTAVATAALTIACASSTLALAASTAADADSVTCVTTFFAALVARLRRESASLFEQADLLLMPAAAALPWPAAQALRMPCAMKPFVSASMPCG